MEQLQISEASPRGANAPAAAISSTPICTLVPFPVEVHDRISIFPSGYFEYGDGKTIKGSVYYPAEADGPGQPFNNRLAGTGATPVVFIAHGNYPTLRKRGNDPSTDPLQWYWERWPGHPDVTDNAEWDPIRNHRGYCYLQSALAAAGIAAVSVDCNDLNLLGDGIRDIEDRAVLIASSIKYFRTLDSERGSLFFRSLDFSRVGLMGHSRGGDAAVTAASAVRIPGVNIIAVLGLAPTNFRYVYGLPSVRPDNYAYLSILTASDGIEGCRQDDARFSAGIASAPYKAQLYTDFTDHNFFNREWSVNESDDENLPPVTSRANHEDLLITYGRAFFRHILLGQPMDRCLAGPQATFGRQKQPAHLKFTRNNRL